MEDTIFNLYSKSDKFWLAFMTGGKAGRKLKLWNYFTTYFTFFYQLSTNLFKYYGLEDQLVKEIERRLFYFGRAGVILHDKKLVAVNANTFEPDIYGRPERFTFSFMNGAKDTGRAGDQRPYTRTINEDGVLGINTYEMLPTSQVAEHFAFLVAHADTTSASTMINFRPGDILKAASESEAEKARAYLNKIYVGEQGVIVDQLEDMEIIRQTSVSLRSSEVMEMRDRYLRDFFNIIGVNRFEEKKERVVVDEVNANEPMLKLDIKDMYDMRLKMCADIGRVFNVDCLVEPVVDLDGDNYIEGSGEDV